MAEVRYFSRSGNTKVIAEAIAVAADVEAKDVSVLIAGQTDVLFLGGALYAGGIAGKLKKFIKTLSPEMSGKVAVFSTTADPDGAYEKIKKHLEKCGITPMKQEFHCTSRQVKDEATQKRAADFARDVLGK
ncbi:MAG: flavodoxin domain-containing protein [Christensenella sp.]|uniref:flavodoxin family protein n=1 Tax=Christensenella sp. TaxID=1935934 RepID=UPI002B1F80BF|nr:flavodoxin domain-containing protein [Christensenella sp.]MEA5002487.1 flavodoxin domain-containing protein [Christensenella sp.]